MHMRRNIVAPWSPDIHLMYVVHLVLLTQIYNQKSVYEYETLAFVNIHNINTCMMLDTRRPKEN